MQFLPRPARLCCAALMALTGGTVGQTMSLWGGDLAGYLPPLWVMSGAGAFGAGLTGLVLADMFGRRGLAGAALSCFGWPIATMLGAIIGAAVVLLGTKRPLVSDPALTIVEGAPLGLLAVADGIATSAVVAGVWMISGVAMHCGARVERHRST